MSGDMFDGLFKFLYFCIAVAIISTGAWVVFGIYHLIKWLF